MRQGTTIILVVLLLLIVLAATIQFVFLVEF